MAGLRQPCPFKPRCPSRSLYDLTSTNKYTVILQWPTRRTCGACPLNLPPVTPRAMPCMAPATLPSRQGYQVSHLEWERDDLQDKLQEAQAQLKQLSQQHGQQQESAYSVARRSTSQQVQQLLPHTRQQAGGAAMAPPVEQLDPYRLLPGRDPEVGFGQQDLVAAVSDFATHVRHMVRPELVSTASGALRCVALQEWASHTSLVACALRLHMPHERRLRF